MQESQLVQGKTVSGSRVGREVGMEADVVVEEEGVEGVGREGAVGEEGGGDLEVGLAGEIRRKVLSLSHSRSGRREFRGSFRNVLSARVICLLYSF